MRPAAGQSDEVPDQEQTRSGRPPSLWRSRRRSGGQVGAGQADDFVLEGRLGQEIFALQHRGAQNPIQAAGQDEGAKGREAFVEAAERAGQGCVALATADGSLFGGYIAALADQALACAAMTVVPDDRTYRTPQLTVSFYRVGRDAPVFIRAEVVAHTRQLISVRASFIQAKDRLIAEAGAQQILLPA